MDQFKIKALEVKMEGGTLIEESFAFMGYVKISQGYMKKFGYFWFIAKEMNEEWEISNYFLSNSRDSITNNKRILGWGSNKFSEKTFELNCKSIASIENDLHCVIYNNDLIEFDSVSHEQNTAQKFGL